MTADAAVVHCHVCRATWAAHEDDVPSTARRHLDTVHPVDAETMITARLGGMRVYTLHRGAPVFVGGELPADAFPPASLADRLPWPASRRPMPNRRSLRSWAFAWLLWASDWLSLPFRTVAYLLRGGPR